ARARSWTSVPTAVQSRKRTPETSTTSSRPGWACSRAVSRASRSWGAEARSSSPATTNRSSCPLRCMSMRIAFITRFLRSGLTGSSCVVSSRVRNLLTVTRRGCPRPLAWGPTPLRHRGPYGFPVLEGNVTPCGGEGVDDQQTSPSVVRLARGLHAGELRRPVPHRDAHEMVVQGEGDVHIRAGVADRVGDQLRADDLGGGGGVRQPPLPAGVVRQVTGDPGRVH